LASSNKITYCTLCVNLVDNI